MIIKEVDAKIIKDSRNEKTIEVHIKTSVGNFFSSAPNGKSKGKYETKPYKKSLEEDIENLKKLSNYFSGDHLEKFEDLRHIEDVVRGHVGGNTLFAFESAALKAIAKEKNLEVWQIINPLANKIPRLVGNCVGGGLHSKSIDDKKPDFQEFLLIPELTEIKDQFKINLDTKKIIGQLLKKKDPKFNGGLNDENAWMTSLNEREVLEILKENSVPLGLDVAASSFYKRKKYNYKNPLLSRDSEEQITYIQNLINKFNLIYCEDPFNEEDFLSHSKLLSLVGKKCLIVGDDLIVTNYKRLKKAITEKAINATIIKPNQNGSLIDLARIVKLAKENSIKTIFSHRSGETIEDILSDLAVGFEADFIKCGITGNVRESKIKRLAKIEFQIKKN